MIQSLWGKVLLIIVIHNHGFIISGSFGLQGNRKFAKGYILIIEGIVEINIIDKYIT